MRILAIGDIHGKDVWKKAIARFNADVVVFIGDYVISKRWVFTKQLLRNLRELIEFKRRNFETVHLLIGNHDLVFLRAHAVRRMFSPTLCREYQNNVNCFTPAFQHVRFLFTHAGISLPWYQRHQSILASSSGSLADKLNRINDSVQANILNERGRARGGNFESGGITYADKSETDMNGIAGYTQIVGHTKVPEILKNDFATGSIIYIDCLNSLDEFLLIDGHKIFAARLDGSSRVLL